jgi:hypothetical protein
LIIVLRARGPPRRCLLDQNRNRMQYRRLRSWLEEVDKLGELRKATRCSCPGDFNNRILVDACIPCDKKLKGTFPIVVDVSADLRKQLRGNSRSCCRNRRMVGAVFAGYSDTHSAEGGER